MNLPQPLADYLARLTASSRAAAWLEVDLEGRYLSGEGALAGYGADGLQPGEFVQDRIGFLSGMVPLAGRPNILLAIEHEDGAYVDAHLIPGDGRDYVLLLDSTPDSSLDRLLQQRRNESTLLRERLSKKESSHEQASRRAGELEQALHHERRKADDLLETILPPAVAQRIKRGETSIADRYAEVSILTLRVDGFPPESTPESEDQTRFLTNLFSAVDRLAGKHDLLTIKSAATRIVAAAGLPTLRADHLQRAADFALAATAPDLGPLPLAIGLDTGAATAGLVLSAGMDYLLWGDPVDAAARLADHAAPGTILVSDAAARELEETHELGESSAGHVLQRRRAGGA